MVLFLVVAYQNHMVLVGYDQEQHNSFRDFDDCEELRYLTLLVPLSHTHHKLDFPDSGEIHVYLLAVTFQVMRRRNLWGYFIFVPCCRIKLGLPHTIPHTTN